MRIRNIIILLVIFLGVGGYFYFSNIPQPPKQPETKLYVWLVDMDAINHIKIDLPKENKSESFIKISEGEKFPWYFDDAQHSSVNQTRWGGGIPLLLSGPGADRIIARDATPEQLTEFGLTQPLMEIALTLTDGNTVNISVGDATPNGLNHYVKAPDSNDVATVDYTWYNVLSGLVRDPPYDTTSSNQTASNP